MVSALQPKRDVSRLEDYLEAIYNLNEEKGFISVADISEKLKVKPPTVSSMVARLAKEGYVERVKYRGMKLTPNGSKVARSVIRRHSTISELLSMLGVGGEVAYEDTEGIEHHLHPVTIQRFERLVDFLRQNPEFLERMKEGIEGA